MSLKAGIASLPGVRQAAVRLLRATARDVTHQNPWTGDDLRLNTYRHKGYWFYGREREADVMRRLSDLIRPGDTVWEIGGHIGFVAQHLARCTGVSGQVVVFEPGRNNLPYLHRNTARIENLTIVEKAVGQTPGTARFFEDNISGQNNSLLDDYHGARSTASSHGIALEKTSYDVEIITLDGWLSTSDRMPDVLKIDIEGGELPALLGATETLARARAVMVEVTESHDEVGHLLLKAGFKLETPNGTPLDAITASGDVFAIR